MPPNEPDLRAIADRMIALIHCVYAKAASDEEFAGQIRAILLTDELSAFLQPRKRKKPMREVFDPVAFRSRNDADRLRGELAAMPLPDLIEITRKHRCMSTKLVKLAEPDALISSILGFAERKLNQGSVFLRSQQTVKVRGDEGTGQEKPSVPGRTAINDSKTESIAD
jgi:hypothetical protein